MFELIKKNISIKSSIIFFIFASLFIFIGSSYRKNKPKDISKFVVTVEKGVLSESINSSGEVKASKSINISPRKPGFIKKLNVKEGDNVKKDKLKELKLRSSKDKEDYLRRKYLFQEGAISREDLESFKNKFETSEAKLNDAIYEKGFYQVKAPFSGNITAKYTEIGSYVAPSTNFSSSNSSTSTKNFIFELSNGLEIIAKVPESDIGRINIGQEALVRIEAFPSKRYLAKVVEIGARAVKDNNVTSFEVNLEFNELSKEIKIGMTADLEFKVKDNKEKILVPTVSIVTEKGKKGVLTVNNKQYPKFKEIKVGITSGSKTSIIEGLEPGEKIFIDIPPWSKRNN